MVDTLSLRFDNRGAASTPGTKNGVMRRVIGYRWPDASLSDLNAQLATADMALAFARRQFNDAVIEYNEAIRQFPTVLIVGLFGFRAAGTL